MPKVSNGTILNNKYRVDAFLQEGGMGQVYKSTEISTDRDVVIKVARYHNGFRYDSIRKLRDEANILKKIQHPDIVKYVDDDIDAEHGFFLVLEYIKVISLKEIYNGKTCPEHDLNNICITLLNVVKYLHNMNILLLGIYPDDIITNGNGKYKIIYVYTGTRVLKSWEYETDRLGAIYEEYFAPELFVGYPTHQSDIFSVGAIMWFLVTGQPPLLRDPNGRILSAKNINSSASDRINSIILKATEPDVANRYQTADEMIQALMISP